MGRGEQTINAAAEDRVPRTKHGYHAFARRFVLPESVEADAMVITDTQGIRAVHLPKAGGHSTSSVPCSWHPNLCSLPCLTWRHSCATAFDGVCLPPAHHC